MGELAAEILAYILIIDIIMIFAKLIVIIFVKRSLASEKLIKYSKITITVNILILVVILLIYALF